MTSTGETIRKRILGKLYLASLKVEDISQSAEDIACELGLDPGVFREIVGSLESEGLCTGSGDSFTLTEKGRTRIKIVMTGGVFEIIHPGHVQTLEQAKRLGDILVVSVARNITVERNKHRVPIHDEKLRRKLVASISLVDGAVLGSETDIFETVLLLKPDIIALGYDQRHSEETIRREIEGKGVAAKVVRLDSSVPDIKTSKIVEGKPEVLRDV